MKSLDIIKTKTWLVSLVCTIFVVYPNAAWFFCGLIYVSPEHFMEFGILFVFRFLYFWATFWGLIRLTLRMKNLHLAKKIIYNLLLSMLCFVVFWILRAPFDVDKVMSIPIFQFLVIGLFSSLLGYIYLLYVDQHEKEREIERLQLESLKSRCDALTNQINPHFFFNSLNGISSLVRKGNNPCTLDYVDKLSDIFRYILQSDKKALVSLDEELEFVEAFSHVMEVRFANKIEFKVDVKEEHRDLRLPVLSLLPLLENVTVHNMIDSEHHMIVCIELNDKYELVVSNPIFPKLSPPDTNGTGLQNLENRFRLMMQQKIRVSDDGEMFTVYLPLK